ncbi:hypothetical protein NPX13_g2262 [Xylaria arbuscula]|uniref:Integrase catalytic domain-containing protein n=1 Tax=Xylaria arbuscula TaxID=114810 RepID=A0A9W8TQK9_9PEZI|nr:hypothetical protein NPX13_g2262 [Xylaria arbuscula]
MEALLRSQTKPTGSRTGDLLPQETMYGWLEQQYEIKVKVIEADNEITINKPEVGRWLEARAIKIKPSAPNTQAQNSGAERSGGVLKAKARAMRIGSRLPTFLWPEILKAATYLYNRTLQRKNGWKTPFDVFFKAVLRKTGRPMAPDKRPDYFNEEEVFDGSEQNFQDDLKTATVEEIQAMVNKCALMESDNVLEDLELEEETEETMVPTGTQIQEDEEELDAGIGNNYPYTMLKFAPFPIPSPSPPSALLCYIIHDGNEVLCNPHNDQDGNEVLCNPHDDQDGNEALRKPHNGNEAICNPHDDHNGNEAI